MLLETYHVTLLVGRIDTHGVGLGEGDIREGEGGGCMREDEGEGI